MDLSARICLSRSWATERHVCTVQRATQNVQGCYYIIVTTFHSKASVSTYITGDRMKEAKEIWICDTSTPDTRRLSEPRLPLCEVPKSEGFDGLRVTM